MDQPKALLTAMAVAVVILTCAVIYLLHQDQQQQTSEVRPPSSIEDQPFSPVYDPAAAQQRQRLEEIEESQKRVECEIKKAQDVPGYRYRHCNIYPGP